MKKLEEQRTKMMSDQMEMSKQQFKPMAYISIISSAIVHVGLSFYFRSHVGASLNFPFLGTSGTYRYILGPIQVLDILVFHYVPCCESVDQESIGCWWNIMLITISGLPGSGTTTVSNLLAKKLWYGNNLRR